MKLFVTKWGIIAGMALFCALMGAAVIPAVFPRAGLLARPLVCPGGEMTTESQTFHPEPGRTVISRYFFCTDPNGARRQLPTLLTLGACTALGFAPALLALAVTLGRAKAEFVTQAAPIPMGNGRSAEATNGHALKKRLAELVEARNAGLITPEEFEEKKKAMLEAL